MRRCLFLLPLLPLALACERYPEDPVFAYGQVLRADGAPVEGLTLGFERGVNPNTFVTGGYVDPPPAFAPYASATTLADGTFTLELTYGALDGWHQKKDESYRFRAAPPLDEQGQGVVGSFAISRGDVELPPLRAWETQLAVTSGAEGATLTFAQPPPAPERPISARVPTYYGSDGESQVVDATRPQPVVQLHGADGLAWQRPEATSPLTLGAQVLEDFALEAQVRAMGVGMWFFEPLGGASSDVEFRLEWRSGRKALAKGALLPVSRGAACWPPKEGACPWTDGKLAPVELSTRPVLVNPNKPSPVEPPPPPSGPPPTEVDEVGLTLATPARPSRAVIRGLEAGVSYPNVQTVVVEGSDDGLTWRPLGSAPVPGREGEEEDPYGMFFNARLGWAGDSPHDPPLLVEEGPVFLELPLTTAEPVKHVRLTVRPQSGTPVLLYLISELSLFE